MSLPSGIAILGLHHVAVADRHEGGFREALTNLFDLTADLVAEVPGFNEHLIDVSSSRVQCLEATGSGLVERFVGKRGTALHHIAFEVVDVAEALAALNRRGAILIDERPRPGGAGTMIGFLHPVSCGGVLVELVEEQSS